MPSTNGHGPKRAILYARVSTDEQARSGYSLAQQIEALREYAAREGKVIATHASRYGFKVNAARDSYEIYEPEMEIVRRIFRMLGVEGRSLNSIAKTLEQQSVPTPKGARYWDRSFFRKCVLDDVYKPHTLDEVRAVVSPEVASRLDPEKCYGLWWFNRRGVDIKQVSEPGPDGRRYRKTYRWYHKPKGEWIAVPVPESGISLDLVETARMAVQNNRRPASAGRRFWELTGGVAYCGGCGYAMSATHSTKTKKGRLYAYDYYRCCNRDKYGAEACTNSHRPRAKDLEPAVWALVSGLLKDPTRLRAGLEELIHEERRAVRGNPDQEVWTWTKKLAEVDRKRGAYQDQQAEGLITLDELRAKLATLEETRTVALRELETLRSRQERIEQLEQDADTLLERYAGMIPETLDSLTSEERHRVYKMLRLRVVVCADGPTEVTGVFGGMLEVTAPRSAKRKGTSRSVLTDGRS
jgi:site-specific DNA recombinase